MFSCFPTTKEYKPKKKQRNELKDASAEALRSIRDASPEAREAKRDIRMYNARVTAIVDELEEYDNFVKYKQRFKMLFDFYKLGELLK